MSHKELSIPKHYGSTNTYEHLTEMSCDKDSEDDELELKKSKILVIVRYLGGTICLIAMVLSCECVCVSLGHSTICGYSITTGLIVFCILYWNV